MRGEGGGGSGPGRGQGGIAASRPATSQSWQAPPHCTRLLRAGVTWCKPPCWSLWAVTVTTSSSCSCSSGRMPSSCSGREVSAASGGRVTGWVGLHRPAGRTNRLTPRISLPTQQGLHNTNPCVFSQSFTVCSRFLPYTTTLLLVFST